MSLLFFKEDTILHYMFHGAWKLPALNGLLERKPEPQSLSADTMCIHPGLVMPPSVRTAHRWHPSSPWTLRIPLPGTAKDSSHPRPPPCSQNIQVLFPALPQLPGHPGHSPRGCSEIPEAHLSDYAFSASAHRSLGLTVP